MHDCEEVGGMSPNPLSEHYNHVRLYNTKLILILGHMLYKVVVCQCRV